MPLAGVAASADAADDCYMAGQRPFAPLPPSCPTLIADVVVGVAGGLARQPGCCGGGGGGGVDVARGSVVVSVADGGSVVIGGAGD